MRLLIITTIFTTFFLCNHADANELKNVSDSYYKMVINGNLSTALSLLESNSKSKEELDLYRNFVTRFIEQNDNYRGEIPKDNALRRIIKLYQEYWRGALLKSDDLDALERKLLQQVNAILVANGMQDVLNTDEPSYGNVLSNLEAYTRSLGYFILTGRTPPLLELSIWEKNETESIEVELTEGGYIVPVTKMETFFSRGWAHYASFGEIQSGGWATTKGLTCVCDSYDQTSEKYRISFLKHEARHYIDFELYPDLSSVDLEYRAKLTELVYAKETLLDLIRKFIKSADNKSEAHHPVANWHVITGLAQRLDVREVLYMEEWNKLDQNRINQVAKALLEESDKLLEKSSKLLLN